MLSIAPAALIWSQGPALQSVSANPSQHQSYQGHPGTFNNTDYMTGNGINVVASEDLLKPQSGVAAAARQQQQKLSNNNNAAKPHALKYIIAIFSAVRLNELGDHSRQPECCSYNNL